MTRKKSKRRSGTIPEKSYTVRPDGKSYSISIGGAFLLKEIEPMLEAVVEIRKAVKPKHKTVIRVVWDKAGEGENLALTNPLEEEPPSLRTDVDQPTFYNRILENTIFDIVPKAKRQDEAVVQVELNSDMKDSFFFGPENQCPPESYDFHTLFLRELLHTCFHGDGFKFISQEEGATKTAMLMNTLTGEEGGEFKKHEVNRWFRMLAFQTTDERYVALVSIIDDHEKLYTAITEGQIYFRTGIAREGQQDLNIAKVAADKDLRHLDRLAYDHTEDCLFLPVLPKGYTMRKITGRLKSILECMKDVSDPGPQIEENDADLEPKTNKKRKRQRVASTKKCSSDEACTLHLN